MQCINFEGGEQRIIRMRATEREREREEGNGPAACCLHWAGPSGNTKSDLERSAAEAAAERTLALKLGGLKDSTPPPCMPCYNNTV